MRAARTCLASLLLVATLAGCGSGGDEQPALTDAQARALVKQLEAARTTAAARDVAATRAALDRFRRSVVRLRRSGALSDQTARTLRIGAARVLERVRSDSAPPAQPAPTTTSQPTPAPPAKKKHGEGKGEKKHGKKDD